MQRLSSRRSRPSAPVEAPRSSTVEPGSASCAIFASESCASGWTVRSYRRAGSTWAVDMIRCMVVRQADQVRVGPRSWPYALVTARLQGQRADDVDEVRSHFAAVERVRTEERPGPPSLHP